MRAFKVFQATSNGELTSAIVEGRAAVIYKPAVENHPPEWLSEKGYGLLAFQREAWAVVYAKQAPIRGYYGIEVWEVEGEPIPLQPIARLNQLAIGNIMPSDLNFWPHETVMFKTVTLIQKCSIR